MFVFKTLTFYINNLLQMTINRVVKIIRICTIDKDWMREEIIRSQIDAMTIHHQFDKRLITCCIKSGKVTSSCFSLVDYLSTAQINGRWICVCVCMFTLYSIHTKMKMKIKDKIHSSFPQTTVCLDEENKKRDLRIVPLFLSYKT